MARNETITYGYDLNGNLTERKHFGYTTGTMIITPFRKTDTYTYDGTWKDLLTGYNGTNNIQYDAIGNPTDYLGKTLEWTQGRRLKSVNGTVSYQYNESGLRTSKTENGVTTQYFWLGNQLLSQSNTSGPAREFVYWYDQTGDMVGFRYNGAHYYYVKNLQGDVIGILDSSHNVVARYAYDTWGKLLKITDGSGNDVTGSTTHIGYLNPVRYRGYYYDNETGLFLVSSRYYDPEIGRFISPDDISYLDPETIGGLNLYAYCLNNPINYYDPDGHWAMPNWLKWVIGGAVILGLGIATVATGGAAAGVAGFIVAGAFKGAVIGAVSGALISGTIGGITSAVSGNDFWHGFADGAADGFMSGAIVGGITGAISSSVQVVNAAKSWATTGGKSGFKQMTQHYTKHVINEGQKSIAKNIVNYTKQAKVFFANNNASGYLLREGVIKIAGAPGGIFNTNGLIRSFWYVLL